MGPLLCDTPGSETCLQQRCGLKLDVIIANQKKILADQARLLKKQPFAQWCRLDPR